jgi:hypothetical protein
VSAPKDGSPPIAPEPARLRLGRLAHALAGPGSLSGTAFGWVIFSSAFVLLYALLSLGCMYGWDAPRLGPANLLTAILVSTWLAHVAVLSVLSIWAWRTPPAVCDSTHRMLAFATRAGYVSSLLATLWLGFPILMLQPCA